MSTTISRGKLFRVTVSVNDDLIKAMRNAPELMMKAVEEGADYWHTGILPRHFQGGAAGFYGYAPRSNAYIKQNRGRPSLVASGSLRNDLCSRAQFKQTGRTVELRLTARVLNLVPRMRENNEDLYVKHGNRKRGTTRTYPNIKREIKAIIDEERDAVAAVVSSGLAIFFKKTQESGGAAAGRLFASRVLPAK